MTTEVEWKALDGFQEFNRCPACGARSNLFTREIEYEGEEITEYSCGSCGEEWGD